jgi:hypothetical protein
MNALISQPFGLGDVIFTKQLINDIVIRSGYESVIWPVEAHFIEGLKRAYPNIEWIPLSPDIQKYISVMKKCVIDDYAIIPIRFANTMLHVPYSRCMRAKYDLYKLDWQTWRNASFQRTPEKENALIEFLGIDMGRPYHLINKRFRTNESGIAPIPNDTSMKNIEMTNINGFSMFDWSKIIENAAHISTVGTSLNYLIELLNLKASYITLYKRMPDEPHYKNYDYILTKHKYIFT